MYRGAHGVSVRSLHQWDSKPCHRKSIARATHAIEFQGGGASVLDKALVPEPVAHAQSHKSRSCFVGMGDMSSKSIRFALWSAW